MAKESDPYTLVNVPLFQMLYGDNLISLGGHAAIESMFSGIQLNQSKALDVGFGLGGVAVYLAEHYQMEVAGVEVHPWMADYARKNAPKEIASRLKFSTYDANGSIPHDVNTFDIVYSKGVLNHISDKASLFKEIARVLKPNGLFVITDWLIPGQNRKILTPLIYETENSYKFFLENAQFNDIQFRDDSLAFINYVKLFIENLDQQQADFENNFDKELWLNIRQTHEALLHELKQGTKLAMRIIAKQQKN